MVEKVTEIDVLCRPVDRTDDPIVVRLLRAKIRYGIQYFILMRYEFQAIVT